MTPYLPQRVIVCVWESRRRDGGTVQRSHDTARKHKVAEHGCHKKIVAEQAMEESTWEGIPGNGIGDGSENPVELSSHVTSVVQLAYSGSSMG